MVLDVKLLEKNLRNIPEEEGRIPEESRKLRTLLLVLAGDQRIIRELSLEDMEELFSESPSLLSFFGRSMDNDFDEAKLENYWDAGRRAV